MQENNQNGYMNYQNMLTKLNTGIVELTKICEQMEMNERVDSLKVIQERMQNHTFSVGIMGEFKRGKSTVINSLLGQEIVPADILPTTATLNRIKWDAKPRAEVNFKDGTKKEVAVEELTNYVTKLTEESEIVAESVEDAVVYYPCRFCQNGVQIVDTPGLNDTERMNQVAESILPTLDAIIMVLVADSPFSISEADFVRNKVMASDLARIIFVVNKIDIVREKDRERVLDSIRKKIQTSVLQKAAAVYGEDSKEYEDTKFKLGGIRIYPVSAIQALDGKLEGDEELIKKSGMNEFEDTLTTLLTEERGMLELVAPVNTILGTAKEVQKMIEMRRNAMELSREEFDNIQKNAIAQIEEARSKKEEEVEYLKAQSKNLYADYLPMIEQIYEELETSLLNIVDQYPLTKDNVKNEETERAAAELIGKELDRQMQICLSENTERLQVKITERIGNEMENIQQFGMNIMENLGSIQYTINKGAGFDEADIAGVIVDTFTNFTGIYGIGGIISGWKANGIPGALVGGGSGFVAGYAAMLAAIGLGLTSALPVFLIGGIVSTFGGKQITKLVFGNKIAEKNIEKLRSILRQNVLQSIDTLRDQRMLENWLKDTSDSAFYTLSEQLDKETEAMLRSTEQTLANIQIDLEKDKTNRKIIMDKLEKSEQILAQICEEVMPIKQKLEITLE